MITGTPASCTRAQNGSNSGRNGDRVPRSPATGAGRISTTRAPRPSSRSNSAMPFVQHARGHDGRREDPALVVIRPLVVQPLVERAQRHHREGRVVLQPLLDQARQRRDHDGRMDALLVEQRQPRGGLAEGRDRAYRLPGQLPQRLSLGVVARVEVLVRAWPRDHLERRNRKRFLWAGGRYRVNAFSVSYRWLSASKTGKPSERILNILSKI
jgi:hypothetical protein